MFSCHNLYSFNTPGQGCTILGHRDALFPATNLCGHATRSAPVIFVGLGAMGLLAQWFYWIGQAEWTSKSRMWRYGVRILLVLFILIHTVIAPISLPVSARGIAQFDRRIERVSASLPSGPEFENKKFILVNTPVYWVFVIWVIERRAVQGYFNPLIALTSGNNHLVITRIDPHTIEIRADKGSLTEYDLTFIKKNITFSMQPGQTVKVNDIHIEILEIKDGLPSAANFRFTVPLEDKSVAWFRWENGTYIPFTPPEIGEAVTIEGARFSMG